MAVIEDFQKWGRKWKLPKELPWPWMKPTGLTFCLNWFKKAWHLVIYCKVTKKYKNFKTKGRLLERVCKLASNIISFTISVFQCAFKSDSYNISIFSFIIMTYLLWWSVISDLYFTTVMSWSLRWWLAFFSNKVFLIKVYTLFFFKT